MTAVHLVCPEHGSAIVHLEVGVVTCPACNRVLGCVAQTINGLPTHVVASRRRFAIEDLAGGNMMHFTATAKSEDGRTFTLEYVRPVPPTA